MSLFGMLRFAVKSFTGGEMLQVGSEAPEFEAKDHDGKTVKLSDYRGHNVVLWFYPKADTPG